MLPLSVSANSAYAEVSVYAAKACSRVIASPGRIGSVDASMMFRYGLIGPSDPIAIVMPASSRDLNGDIWAVRSAPNRFTNSSVRLRNAGFRTTTAPISRTCENRSGMIPVPCSRPCASLHPGTPRPCGLRSRERLVVHHSRAILAAWPPCRSLGNTYSRLSLNCRCKVCAGLRRGQLANRPEAI